MFERNTQPFNFKELPNTTKRSPLLVRGLGGGHSFGTEIELSQPERDSIKLFTF
jgi:hypothetical protein